MSENMQSLWTMVIGLIWLPIVCGLVLANIRNLVTENYRNLWTNNLVILISIAIMAFLSNMINN